MCLVKLERFGAQSNLISACTKDAVRCVRLPDCGGQQAVPQGTSLPRKGVNTPGRAGCQRPEPAAALGRGKAEDRGRRWPFGLPSAASCCHLVTVRAGWKRPRMLMTRVCHRMRLSPSSELPFSLRSVAARGGAGLLRSCLLVSP